MDSGDDDGTRISLWHATATAPEFPPLEQDTRVDACVVGAGITGIGTALELARRGHSVLVLDDGAVGGGVTGRTTGHLASAIDDRFYWLARMHGSDGARLAAASHAAAIDFIEANVARHAIDCDFERLPAWLMCGAGRGREELETELDAASRAGLEVSLHQNFAPTGRSLGSALRFARQGQMHPLRYLYGLAEAVRREGGRICTGNHVVAVEDGAPVRVTLQDGTVVECGAAVVATDSPINDRFVMQTRQAAYRTYAIALRVPEGTWPAALLWQTGDPYKYVRAWHDRGAGEHWLLVGGEDHKTGQPEGGDPFAALRQWTAAALGIDAAPGYAWSGQIIEPHDGLAFIGRNPGDEHVFIACGDSGNGLTHGSIAAMLLPALIEGHDHPWATLYSPSRRSLRASGEYLRENANVAAQYRELLTGGDVDSVDAIAAGEGAVLRRGFHKLAVFRDDAGALHAHSAICTHLGCVVGWNAVEKSWDCPCHGSRFDARDGRVLDGPAAYPLHPAELPGD
ncbi:MAG: FAD-dependent oxidoreductase [Xanthomonadales bacterium]|nr:FAD-dependent oxidoreductase [Xanthomonadales bacterium]